METWYWPELEDAKWEWGDGAWNGEPDKAHWRAHDLDCVILRETHRGNHSGFVGVPEGHPRYGAMIDLDVQVHGGLMFADTCKELTGCGIGRLPEPAAGGMWWFGFGCADLGDLIPGFEARLREAEDRMGLRPLFRFLAKEYRDFDYVQREVECLAEQLKGTE